MSARPTALLVTGGHSHPAELSAPAIERVADRCGLDLVVDDDPEAAFAALASADHRLLIVNALRWTMTDPLYDEFREEWSFSLSPAARRGLRHWVDHGRPLLALHTAVVSFDDWSEWGDIIGASWAWGRSSHPPLAPVEVKLQPGHAATSGLADFTVTDECYLGLDHRAYNQVLATVTAGGSEPQPAAWVRSNGHRVATSTLGHDLASLDQPDHQALLCGLTDWLLSTDRALGAS